MVSAPVIANKPKVKRRLQIIFTSHLRFPAIQHHPIRVVRSRQGAITSLPTLCQIHAVRGGLHR